MSLDVRVEHWWGRLPLQTIDGVDGPYDGVTRVYISRSGNTMILAGRDTYWIYDDRFGCFNQPENHRRWGRQQSSWRWPEGQNPQPDDAPVPDGATVWQGVMLPDNQAREVGLL